VKEKRKNNSTTPKILFEDKSLLVIDKPPFWVVNDSETSKNTTTLQKWLEEKDYPISRRKNLRSGIVHRLDKETSGLLLVAKDEESFIKLQSQFKQRKVSKGYFALVHGRLTKRGVIQTPIGRLPWNRKRFGVVPGGKPAITYYQPQKIYKKAGNFFSFVKVFPKTGRTHQIRVHFKYLGFPIVSDDLYAGRKTFRDDRNWCPRLFLHAFSLKFTHPKTNEKVGFVLPLAKDLAKALSFCDLVDDKLDI